MKALRLCIWAAIGVMLAGPAFADTVDLPEPGTIVLLAGGIAGLAVAKFSRRKR